MQPGGELLADSCGKGWVDRVDDRDGTAERESRRGDLGPDEPGPDDEQPSFWDERGAKPIRVRPGAKHMDARVLDPGQRRHRRSPAGGKNDDIALNRLAVVEGDGKALGPEDQATRGGGPDAHLLLGIPIRLLEKESSGVHGPG